MKSRPMQIVLGVLLIFVVVLLFDLGSVRSDIVDGFRDGYSGTHR